MTSRLGRVATVLAAFRGRGGTRVEDVSIRPAVAFVVHGCRGRLAAMSAMAFAGGVSEALFLIIATRAAFAVTDHNDRVGLVLGRYVSVGTALWLAFAAVAVRVVLAVVANWQASVVSSSVVARIRHRLTSAFLQAAWPVQQGMRGGNLQELLSGYSGQASGMMSGVNQGLVSGASLVALLGIAIGVDPLGAVVLVASVAVLGLVLRPLRGAVKRRSQRSAAAGMELAVVVNDVSRLGLELHVFHAQEPTQALVTDRIEEARRRNRSHIFVAGLTTPLYLGLAYGALVAALALVAISSATSLTSLGAAMLVMLRSLSYGQALQSAYISLASSSPLIDELRRQLDVLETGRTSFGDEPVPDVGRLSVQGLEFAYQGTERVLKNISFAIEPREVVGIVGPSGSGKSTLVQLLLGLREPLGGTIQMDGRDIRTIDRQEWARKVTFVPQEARLIRGSIADNIRFFRYGVGDEDVERAAKLAHLHQDIVAFPEGYAREVGDEGGRLSGGQRQRLTIARALVESPTVIILDEPTSALDARSEHLIRRTLLELKDRMTVIIIAHRLSTLNICDRIMVIQDGRLVAFDRPEKLADEAGFYREALDLSGSS
jgi:ABC-type multidrug transport system fused ATPase/permease subunit